MDLAETKERASGSEKNKSAETNKNFPQEHAPHYSDCFDQAAWAVNEMNRWPEAHSYAPALVLR